MTYNIVWQMISTFHAPRIRMINPDRHAAFRVRAGRNFFLDFLRFFEEIHSFPPKSSVLYFIGRGLRWGHSWFRQMTARFGAISSLPNKSRTNGLLSNPK